MAVRTRAWLDHAHHRAIVCTLEDYGKCTSTGVHHRTRGGLFPCTGRWYGGSVTCSTAGRRFSGEELRRWWSSLSITRTCMLGSGVGPGRCGEAAGSIMFGLACSCWAWHAHAHAGSRTWPCWSAISTVELTCASGIAGRHFAPRRRSSSTCSEHGRCACACGWRVAPVRQAWGHRAVLPMRRSHRQWVALRGVG